MLNRNVYILYPAGYHGSYLKWALEVSDPQNLNIVKDPINIESGDKFGGPGTAHLHTRVPSHHNLEILLYWILRNRPQDNRIYLINTMCGRANACYSAANLLTWDANGIVIVLHDDDDPDLISYGHINCVIKWPTFLLTFKDRFSWHEGFDAFACADDRQFRNWIVKNDWFLGSCARPDPEKVQQTADTFIDKWYKVRNQYQPHEVNNQTYPDHLDMTDRFFALPISHILKSTFISDLETIITDGALLDHKDTGPVQEIHDTYVRSQPNLAWFESIKNWRETGRLDPYLCSHSIIQAQIISQILRQRHVYYPSRETVNHWMSGYQNVKDPYWPPIIDWQGFFYLSKDVLDQLGLLGLPDFSLPPDKAFTSLDWENMGIHQINDYYQERKQQPFTL